MLKETHVQTLYIILSDKDYKLIVSQRNEPQPNCFYHTEEQGLRYTGEQLGEPHHSPVLFGNKACSPIIELHRVRWQHEGIAAEELKERLPGKMQRAMIVASEKGASSWLLTLPITDHGFDLHIQGCPLTAVWVAPTPPTITLCL